VFEGRFDERCSVQRMQRGGRPFSEIELDLGGGLVEASPKGEGEKEPRRPFVGIIVPPLAPAMYSL